MKYYVYNYVDRSNISDKEFVDRNLFSNNIGNIFFLQAVCNSLDGEITGNPNEEDIDTYVLPLANMFRGNGLIPETIYLKKLLQHSAEKKIVVVGVGAQGKLDNSVNYSDEAADNSAYEFCNYILMHSKTIGVRGNYTKKYLTALGISPDQIDVIGCPSLRMYGRRFDISPKIYKKFAKNLKIAVNFTPYDYSENIGIFLYKVFRNYNNSYAMMQDKVEYDMIYNGKAITDRNRIHALLPTYKDNFVITSNRARMFLSVAEWKRCLSTFDFCIGTRIHGNIISILSGCPSLVIAIDSRTRELAEYHHIPYISANEINEETSLELLYYRACSGMNEFYSHYNSGLKEYSDFMKKNGIKIKEDWQVSK